MRTVIPRASKLGVGAEALEVCVRCFYAVEIRRLAAQPFATPEGDLVAAEALEACFSTLKTLRDVAEAEASSSHESGNRESIIVCDEDQETDSQRLKRRKKEKAEAGR